MTDPDRPDIATRFTSETGAAAGSVAKAYKPEFVELARELAEAGALDHEIAEEMGVARRQLYRWKHRYPEFAEALAVGKAPVDQRVKRSMFETATGFFYTEQQAIKIKIQEKTGTFREEVVVVDVERYQPPNATMQVYWSKNRMKDEFRDKVEHEHSGPDGGAIMAQVTVDAVVARLAKLDDDC